ncbi:SGMR1-like protein [Mya arenaria]|uniref:Sigma non-opioid intracellular receptor 1 n=1 Tax=Mya arenaria TaxID=6604 RepID=A0ABY7F077_MYAAR|nr:sigma non-opioid intracellular receptor 1-like [Mya arenaria]WAR14619.1 SGMR1-like protein [Mya arenaria]
MFFMCLNVFKLLFFISLCFVGIRYWMQKKSYVFSADIVEEITLNHFGKNITVAYDDIYDEFLERFPGHVLPVEHRKWIFMNAGGWMGAIHILHASLTEYLLFFGTAVNTSGNSGRYWANISDTILTGSFRQWQEGALGSTIFLPGQTVYHYEWEAAAVEWTAGTWMVEYGRGCIPSTLFFALADTFTSTLDFVTLFYILRVYANALIMEAIAVIGDMVSMG